MRKRSKRYEEASKRIDRTKLYPPREALGLLKALPPPKFDETVDVVVRLGIDPKKTDQLVRGAVSLPKGLGKSVRVIVFAEGERAESARKAGADEVGSEELAKRILDGWLDFDIVIASPDMMKHVGKLGKVLGPQGKMPSPKSGTVTPDVAKAVNEFKAGKVEFRTDAGGNVHVPLGKRSFETADLEANL
ncbi:MAG TPA: 50S ribosomal protein L1, partial [Planctomycetota bacterium]